MHQKHCAEPVCQRLFFLQTSNDTIFCYHCLCYSPWNFFVPLTNQKKCPWNQEKFLWQKRLKIVRKIFWKVPMAKLKKKIPIKVIVTIVENLAMSKTKVPLTFFFLIQNAKKNLPKAQKNTFSSININYPLCMSKL